VTPIDEVSFLRKLQRLLEEGDFVATYKFALLQALADLSVENEPEAKGTLAISLEQLAEKFIEYYWRQARPYRDGIALLQNSGKQAAILNRVAHAHGRYEVSLGAARRDAKGWQELVASVAATIETMPLWKLQVIAGRTEEFLYRRETFQCGRLVLEPGIAKCFRSFHPFIVNMVRGAWVDHLLRIRTNQGLVGEQGDLSEFLFGSERRPLNDFRAILREHQSGKCFYCDQGVPGAGALDHFVPWIRYPVDLGHNFVFAHPKCNSRKRDYLAHPDHLLRWREQNLDCGDELATKFDRIKLRHEADRSRKIAHWAYEQAELAQARVWIAADEFAGLGGEWRQALRSNTLGVCHV
jgi:5-methylcytosine-specific restriction endonuclease McrA